MLRITICISKISFEIHAGLSRKFHNMYKGNSMPDYGNKVLKLVLDSKLPDYNYIPEQGKNIQTRKTNVKCTLLEIKLHSCFKQLIETPISKEERIKDIQMYNFNSMGKLDSRYPHLPKQAMRYLSKQYNAKASQQSLMLSQQNVTFEFRIDMNC